MRVGRAPRLLPAARVVQITESSAFTTRDEHRRMGTLLRNPAGSDFTEAFDWYGLFMGPLVKGRMLLAVSAVLLLTGCAAQAPAHPMVGSYRDASGAEVQLDGDGRGSFLNVPAEAVLGGDGLVSGPVKWSTTGRSDGALDMRFYGGAGIRPDSYEDSGMGAVYRVDGRPRIEFTIGDPDEGHHLVLTFVEN